MKFLLIGHSVEDHIFENGNTKPVQPGGIFYSAAGIYFLKEINDEVFLSTNISENNYYLFSEVYENINKSLFNYVKNVPKVHLTIHKEKEREEKYENIDSEINIKLIDYNLFAGIYINMITGFDITLEKLKEIRSMYDGIIYLDAHSLTRGIDSELKRNFRNILNYIDWCSNIDILQCNEFEIKTFGNSNDEEVIVKELLQSGIKFIIITQGIKGAKIYSLKENNLIVFFQPAIKSENKNSVGCGDVFGIITFYYYCKNNNIENAVLNGTKAASLIASYENIKLINNLSNDFYKQFN